MGYSVVQVVVPFKFRDVVLNTSHDGVAGHLGVKETYDKVVRHFFWPQLKRDVANYCKTCKTSQLTGKPKSEAEAGSPVSNPCCGEAF